VIRFDDVTFTYAGAGAPALRDVDLAIPDGELVLVIGPTGSGKSTLLRTVNGLVPHFTGGTLRGRVTVDGRDTRTEPPRELADTVGYVGQDPVAGFVTDAVEDELAYGMESLGIAPAVMRRRVEETLDVLGLAALRDRPLGRLSAGQQQRVAIGSVLTAGARVLVLDEPTSALDPTAAEDVLATLTRLVHDLGLTVLLAEHRLERVIQYADRIVSLLPDGRVRVEAPADAMTTARVAPPVVELGRLAGWRPLPLSVRDARRAAAGLRDRLADYADAAPTSPDDVRPDAAPVVEIADLRATYGPVVALRGATLTVRPGERVAVMGRNGAGKSTLLAHLAGLAKPAGGRLEVCGRRPATLAPAQARALVALVPQQPGDLLCGQTVADECAQEVDPDAAAALLDRLAPGVARDAHPRDLSEGQRLALALAIVLAPRPPVLLLDEPTRGLDYPAKGRLVEILRDQAAAGTAIVVATHDVEFAAEFASRVVVLADGEVVTDGPAAQVLTDSPAFAPQVAKIVHPLRWLTVREVRAALQASAS
jgi:energy-coupling factor transporter ATP-binding protein EcfA2